MRAPSLICPKLRRFFLMLEDALEKERDTWQQYNYPRTVTISEEETIGRDHRDQTVEWLFKLNSHIKLNPETAVLSVNILDSFLHVVKARPKYLRCIAVTCLFIAAKILEEDDVIPPVEYLVTATMIPCSVADILRMEMIILNKLHWNVRRVTALDFLYILHAILVCEQPNLLSMYRHMTVSRQLTMLVRKLLVCQESSEVVGFAPSTQALAIISLELGLFTPSWLAITIMLQKLIQVDNKELIQCREVMANAISTRTASSFYLSHQPTRTTRKKRKAEQLKNDGDDADDIYDSIKRLYGDESMSMSTYDVVQKISTCGREVQMDEPTAIHVLQAV